LAVPIALAALILAFGQGQFFRNGINSAIDLLTIGLLFPALLLGVGGATPGPRTARICKWVGDAFYPVYLPQTPLMGVFAALPQLILGTKAANLVPWIGYAHVTGTIVCAL
jgi:hypothetical protein